jgi:resuscitation-promoting factor RpfB
MYRLWRMVLVCCLLFCGCASSTPITITILDNGQIRRLVTNERIPAALLVQAGIVLRSADQVLLNGYQIKPDQTLPSVKFYTLQIRRALTLTINGQATQSAALTVGQALSEAGIPVYTQDRLEPPSNTPITTAITIRSTPSKVFNVTMDGRQIRIRSSAQTVGSVLAEAGIPLVGLDASQPAENEIAPTDGQMHVARISEALVLAQKSIPFNSDFQSSSDVELDHQEVLQPGQPGLAVSRTRIRFEDGKEVARQTETEAVVRPPKDRVVGYGTKVVVHTATIGGVPIKYWRAVQMFTTAYSPCNSGGDRCFSGTSSGKPVQKGVAAVRYSWYLNMQGQALFIPGYGFATIEDVCGGCVGKPWIDLGYTDAQYQQEGGQWGKYVTVYFLAPPPPNILDILE